MDDSRPTTKDSGPRLVTPTSRSSLGHCSAYHIYRNNLSGLLIPTALPSYQQATTTSSATTKNAPRLPYSLLWLALKAIRPWHLPSTAYNLVQQISLVLLSYFPRPSLRTTKPDAPSSDPTPTNRSCTPPSTWYTDIYDPVAHRQPGTVPLFSP